MTLARKVAITTVSLVIGRALALLAGVGATALASRYLGLEAFGALTLAMAVVSLISVLTDLGMSTMAAREVARTPEREREILGNVLSLGLAFSVVAALLLLAVAELAYAGNPDVRRAMLVLSLQLLTAPFLGAARAHFQAAQRGQLIAVGDVALAAAIFGGSLIAVEADLGFTAMVGAVAAGYLVQAAVMTILVKADVRLAWRVNRDTWTLLLRISLPLGATFIINYLYFRLDVVLLSVLKGEEEVGLYGLAYRVLEGLMVLPSYFMLALFPEIARLTGQRERVDAIVAAALSVMEAVALPVVLITAVFAADVIEVIAGAEYADAEWVLRILTLGLGISYLNGVYGSALTALGRQNQLFRWSLVILVCNLAINLALIPPFGVVGAGVAVVISELLAFVVVRRLYTQVGTAPPLVVNVRMLLAGAAMVIAAAPALLLPGGLAGSLAAVVVGATSGALVYAAALIALRAVPAAVAAHVPPRILRFGRTP
jgi:O-antigen/teichoic acid export membrane protein